MERNKKKKRVATEQDRKGREHIEEEKSRQWTRQTWHRNTEREKKINVSTFQYTLCGWCYVSHFAWPVIASAPHKHVLGNVAKPGKKHFSGQTADLYFFPGTRKFLHWLPRVNKASKCLWVCSWQGIVKERLIKWKVKLIDYLLGVRCLYAISAQNERDFWWK